MNELLKEIKYSFLLYGIATFVSVLVLAYGYIFTDLNTLTTLDTYAIMFIIFGIPMFITFDIIAATVKFFYRKYKGL